MNTKKPRALALLLSLCMVLSLLPVSALATEGDDPKLGIIKVNNVAVSPKEDQNTTFVAEAVVDNYNDVSVEVTNANGVTLTTQKYIVNDGTGTADFDNDGENLSGATTVDVSTNHVIWIKLAATVEGTETAETFKITVLEKTPALEIANDGSDTFAMEAADAKEATFKLKATSEGTVKLYTDKAMTEAATDVEGTIDKENSALKLTFTNVPDVDVTYYVTVTEDGKAESDPLEVNVTAFVESKEQTETPVAADPAAVELAEGNTTGSLVVTNEYADGATVKVYDAATNGNVVAGTHTYTSNSKTIAFSFNEAVATEKTYYVSVTETGKTESDRLAVTFTPYDDGGDAVSATIEATGEIKAGSYSEDGPATVTVTSDKAFKETAFDAATDFEVTGMTVKSVTLDQNDGNKKTVIFELTGEVAAEAKVEITAKASAFADDAGVTADSNTVEITVAALVKAELTTDTAVIAAKEYTDAEPLEIKVIADKAFADPIVAANFAADEGDTGLTIKGEAALDETDTDNKTVVFKFTGTAVDGKSLTISIKKAAFAAEAGVEDDCDDLLIEVKDTSKIYTIKFAAGQDGTGTMANAIVDKAASGNTEYTLPECGFTAEGKEFDKWTVNAIEGVSISDDGTKLVIAETVANTADITLTATWKDVPQAEKTALTIDPATVKAESDNQTAKLTVKSTYTKEVTVKVYDVPANAEDELTESTAVTDAVFANGVLTLTLSEGTLTEDGEAVSYLVAFTEADKTESDTVKVTINPYVRSNNANLTRVLINNLEVAAEDTTYAASIAADAVGITVIVTPADENISVIKYSTAAEVPADWTTVETALTLGGDDEVEGMYGIYIEGIPASKTIWLHVVPENGKEADAKTYKVTIEQLSFAIDVIETPTEGVQIADPEVKAVVENAVKNTAFDDNDFETGNKVTTAVVEAVKDVDTSNAAEKLSEVVGALDPEAEVKIFAVPYLDIKVADDGYNAETKEYVLDVTPMVMLYATTAEVESAADMDETNSVKLMDQAKELDSLTNIKVFLPLPTGFVTEEDETQTVYVKVDDDPIEKSYTAEKDEVGYYIIVDAPHFSVYSLSRVSSSKAVIGETGYNTVQAAVDAVEDGQTIVLAATVTAAEVTGLTAPAKAMTFSIDATAAENVTAITFTNTTVEGKVYSAEATNAEGVYTVVVTEVVPAAVAKIGDTEYTTLAAAIAAVPNNGIIVLLDDVTEDVEIARAIVFTLDLNEHTVAADKIKAAAGYTLKVNNETNLYTVTKNSTSTVSGGSGGGSSTTSYVKSGKTENGSFSISNKNAKVGATVTITPKANEGYVVDKVTVTDKNGDTVKVTLNSDGTYSFEMPSTRPVTVNVTFKEADKTHPSVDTFRDVSANDWFVDAVDYVLANNLMTGTSSTTFEPEATTTRGMVVTILYRLEKEPEAGAADFGDVADGEWYSKAVAWAAENNIVNGYDNGNFGPNDDITREQLVAILYRYSQFKKYDVTAQGSLTGYTDANVINDYAQTAMSWANATGLVLGTSDTTLEPASNATRAQVATVLMRFCEDIAK